MAKDPLLPDPPQSGDSWESLAGNLFGIDLNADGESGLLSDEELESLEVAPPEPPPIVAEETEEPVNVSFEEEEEVNVSFEEDEEDEFNVSFEEEEEEAGDDDVSAAQPVKTAKPSNAPSAPAKKSGDSEQSGGSEEDTFWDPLASWEWDDDDAGAKAATREAAEKANVEEDGEEAEVVKGPGTDARRASEEFETVSDYRTEYDADDSDEEWSFGAGLLEDVPAPKPEKSEKKTEKRPKPDRPKSKKREPRKSRDEDRSESPKPRESTRSESRTEKPRSEKPRREQRDLKPAPASSEAEGDDFAAGLLGESKPERETSSRDEEAPREKRSRRGGRRRRSSSKEKSTDAPKVDADSTDFGAGLDSDIDEEPKKERQEKSRSEKKKAPYRNIPTWETAISYMLKNAPSGGDKGNSSDGEGKSERRPRRRRRRRPRS